MNKTIQLFVLMLLLSQTFINCSKRDNSDNKNDKEKLIIGKWYIDPNNRDYFAFEFFSDGLFNYTYLGDDDNEEGYIKKGKWFISDDNLNVSHSDENFMAKILVLTNKELKLKEYVDEEYNIVTFYK